MQTYWGIRFRESRTFPTWFRRASRGAHDKPLFSVSAASWWVAAFPASRTRLHHLGSNHFLRRVGTCPHGSDHTKVFPKSTQFMDGLARVAAGAAYSPLS